MDVSKFNLFGVLFNFKDKKARDDHAALAETVGEHGTEIDGLKAPTFSEPAANANVREAVAKIKSGTAIGTLFTNVKAALNGLITLGEMRNYLVNNGTVTETGKYFLDAAYGKTLLDQITALNSNLNGYKIYTSISQLGLSTYSSIVQLVNTLPSNSILTFTITNSEWEQSLYPMLWGEVFIQKYSTRARVIFTSQQISSDDNYAYIKYTNYNDETNWARIILDTAINPNGIWKFDSTNAITIPNGADMKDSTYLELGVYKCDTSAGSATLKNCPTNDAFTLFVYKTLANHAKYITQEFRTISNEIYKRYYNGYDEYKGWKSDVKFITNQNLFSIATGNIIYGMKGIYIGKFNNGPKRSNGQVFDFCLYFVVSGSSETASYAFTISQYSEGHLFFNRMSSNNTWELSSWKKLIA